MQWSVTGACNLACRHCFMSAPHAKHGSPSHEQIIAIADQLAECGVSQVGITGGEPLIREDFLDIIDALNERDIAIATLYTNGWLVDEALLDELDKRHVHPAFQLSFDGVGFHDFLRGVPGAEERTLRALRLLQERDYPVSVSMCMHRKNRHALRDSVNLLASLGVRYLKCGSMMELGEWTQPEVLDLQLTWEEELQMFEEYIPQYFEDDAPLPIMLAGVFMYTPGDPEWKIYHKTVCTAGDESRMPSCGVLRDSFYIGAEGMVCPCMGMGDCGYAENFQNLFETPLKDILGGEAFKRLCNAKVGEIRATAEELNEEQKRETEASASEVESLSLDDLDAAARGADSGACSDTFRQRENCLSNDGCDKYINDYDNYECLHNNRYHHCSTIDSVYCVNAFIPFKSR